MLITIVAVANADNTGLDLDRLEKVEDLDPEIAWKMLDVGTGRVPSEKELAAYRDAHPDTGTDSASEAPEPSAEAAPVPAAEQPALPLEVE
jgi:hypothetical protein